MNILEFTFKWQVFGRLLHYSINEETGEYHMKVDEPEEVVPLTIEERKIRSDSVFFINICIGVALALIFGVHVGPSSRYDSLSGIVVSKAADLFRFIFPAASLENSLLILALIVLLTIYITIRTDAWSWRLHLNVASFNILYFGYSSHAVSGYEYGRRHRQSTIVKPVTTPEMVVKPKEEEEDNVQLLEKTLHMIEEEDYEILQLRLKLLLLEKKMKKTQ
jgi:hypothetical protein